MKKISGIFLLFLCISGFAQKDKNAQWISLFNGKDLSGWKQLNGNAPYKVINGEIVGFSKAGESNSFLATTKDYGDFILELELLADSTLNSGIQFRSESKPDYMNGRVHGYQAEFDPSARAWSGGIYDEARRLWLYPLELNNKGKSAYKNGQWNHYRIEAIGNTMRVWLNNIPTAHLVDDLTPKGFIALQVHAIGKNDKEGKEVRWKNIRIQTSNLKPSKMDDIYVVNLIPNNLSEQEKATGYKLLFDGKNTDQWRGAYKTTFPKSGWNIENGELSVQKMDGSESTNGGDIVTKDQFGAFIFKFDFKITDSANSGVKYFVTENEFNKGSAIGPEYQILDDIKNPDSKLGKEENRTMGSLYDLIASKKIPAAQKPIGAWNQGIIKVFPDNKIEYWLNGYKILEYTRGSKEFFALVADSKYKNWKNFGMAPKGHILLQDHGDKVSFRSLKIKKLK